MKKTLILFFVAAGLIIFLLPAAFIAVEGKKDRVAITQEVLFGDPGAASGITLAIASHWNRHLLWNTEYTIGEEKTKSEFTFSGKSTLWGWERKTNANFYFGTAKSALENGKNSSATCAESAFPEIANKVAYRTWDDKYSEIVSIAEYYEIYPLIFRMEGSMAKYHCDHDTTKYLSELFHISPEKDRLEVVVEKDSNGRPSLVQQRIVREDLPVSLVNLSAEARDGIYYTYRLEAGDCEENIDRGQNTGIFFIPYRGEGEAREIDLLEMKKICELLSDVVPLELKLNQSGDILYLAAKSKGGYSLFVYQLDGGVHLKQEICLENIRDTSSYCQMNPVDGGVLFTWNDNQFSFVAEDGGEYFWWCGGIFPQTMGEISEEGVQNPFPRENVLHFDGTRLVLAAFENWENMEIRLIVYNREGELYCGRYKNSQDCMRGLAAGDHIEPQGVRLWAPNRAWSAGKDDPIVFPLSLTVIE